jgi:hypothetical protein
VRAGFERRERLVIGLVEDDDAFDLTLVPLRPNRLEGAKE